ncbi:MAG: fibronectin type III domain-containing protein [Clostridiales bacterium]|nr:fibronectin type III domain-containing protein [Clostridiales bacterium]
MKAKLINQTGSTTYYTVYSVASDSAKKTVKNQVISAGVYYLAVDCAGSYKLNATFGGNCYENPQKLKTETEATGKKPLTRTAGGIRLKLQKNTTYRFSAAAYGDLTVKIYNSDLSETVKTVTLTGSKKSPVKEKSNITLSKGKYYIKVTSNAKYKLSVCKLTKKNCDHIYVHENIKSAYTTKGYVKHTCTLCGYSYKDQYKALKILSAPAVSVRAKSSSITVKCTRVYRATGYQIQYSTSSDFSSSAKIKTKDLTEKITSLSGSTKYYVRVRAYKTVGSKTVYSSWSAVQTARTK